MVSLCTFFFFLNSDMDNVACIQAIQRGERMERPADCPVTLYDIILLCWHSNPDERPAFMELHDKLSALIPEPVVVLDENFAAVDIN